HRPNRETIEPNNKIPKLAHLFYITKKLHRNNEEYCYNDEAKKFIKDAIYNYDILSSDKSNEDDFLASCYQKSMERVERLSLALHILKISSCRLFNMVDTLGTFSNLNDQFKIVCADQELNEAEHTIDYDTCFRASLLTKFYLNQTKILAGYDPVTDNILLNKKSTVDVPENEIKHIKQYIENHPSDRLLLSSLPANLKRKISKDQYLMILQEMEIIKKNDQIEEHHTQIDQSEQHRTQIDQSEQHRTQIDQSEQHRTQIDQSEQHRTQADRSDEYHTQLESAEQHRTQLESTEQHRTQADRSGEYHTQLDQSEQFIVQNFNAGISMMLKENNA
ncbi:unnamed protein product, partial [Rotaria magnacalcarata]